MAEEVHIDLAAARQSLGVEKDIALAAERSTGLAEEHRRLGGAEGNLGAEEHPTDLVEGRRSLAAGSLGEDTGSAWGAVGCRLVAEDEMVDGDGDVDVAMQAGESNSAGMAARRRLEVEVRVVRSMTWPRLGGEDGREGARAQRQRNTNDDLSGCTRRRQ